MSLWWWWCCFGWERGWCLVKCSGAQSIAQVMADCLVKFDKHGDCSTSWFRNSCDVRRRLGRELQRTDLFAVAIVCIIIKATQSAAFS